MANELTAERRNRLAEILVSEGSVRVGKLAKMLNVSTETIRKDLIYLDQNGIASKSFGGAVASGNLLHISAQANEVEHKEEKEKIARTAVEMIPERSVVILDAGSTTWSLAKLLTVRKNITVITNSVKITQLLLNSDIRVFVVGGELRRSDTALVGMWASNALATVKADFAFLGTDGFSSRAGPCSASFAEADAKQAMMRSAKQKILVADSSKFKADCLFQYCRWQDLSCLVTDDSASAEDINSIRRFTEVRIAR